MFSKRKPLVSQKLRKSAQGQECQVRIPGVCSFDSATVVLAHVDDASVTGKGIGLKGDDMLSAHCCYQCHEWLGGGYSAHDVARETRDLYHYQAMARTLLWWRENGYISIAK
jgi:hypothetical protein